MTHVHRLFIFEAPPVRLATTASGPNSRGRNGALTFDTDKVKHRNLAIASISVATAGYLIMLVGNG